MEPVHVALADIIAEVDDTQRFYLVLFHQGHNRGSPPIADRLDIDAEVAIPAAGKGRGLLLARAKRDADPAVRVTGSYAGDLQRMRVAGAPRQGSLSPLELTNIASP